MQGQLIVLFKILLQGKLFNFSIEVAIQKLWYMDEGTESWFKKITLWNHTKSTWSVTNLVWHLEGALPQENPWNPAQKVEES